MPHRDTSLAINKLYILISNDGDDPTWLYINTGFSDPMPHRDTSLAINKLNILISNDGDDSTCLSKKGFSLAIHKLDIDP